MKKETIYSHFTNEPTDEMLIAREQLLAHDIKVDNAVSKYTGGTWESDIPTSINYE